MSNITLNYAQIIDPLSFKSINLAKIYIGEYGTLPNPANASTWKQAYFVNSDGARTAASQPIRTNAAGYAVDGSGNIKTVQVDGGYSLLVQDQFGATKFSQACSPANDGAVLEFDTIAGFDGALDGSAIFFKGRDTIGDGGGGMFRYSASSTTTADGGTVFAPAGGGRLLREGWSNDTVDPRWWGIANAGADESAKVAAMVAAVNVLRVPAGFTLVCKNIELNANTKVFIDGIIKLPNGCSDFDRLIYATSKSGVEINIREINGNAAGQSGNIGTHLIYATNCPDIKVSVTYAHDHYIASGAAMPSVDGIRNASTGAIYLYRCARADLSVTLIEGWGREGVYLEECDDAVATLGHAQATGNTEYSGIQVKGKRSKLLRASVDNAGASGVGFDVTDGALSNVISTNTRENHGVNFGHPSFPASRSVASNIVVDGCLLDGIKVSSATTDITVSNFAVQNAGRYGFSVSDSSVRGKFSDGVVSGSGQANAFVSATEIQTSNVRYSDVDALSLEIAVSSGTYAAGETVTASGGKSATVRRVIKNLTGATQVLLLTGVTGTFAAGNIVTGGTSAATGTVSVASTPVDRLEQLGGYIADPIRLMSGTQDQIRFPDGTAILTASASVVIASPGTLTTTLINYSSNVVWASAPRVVAQVGSATSTGTYTMSQLEASSTTTELRLDVIASVAQTYGIAVIAIGRWK